MDAYNALKDLIKRKFGGESELARAVEDLEADPEDKGRPITLEGKVKKVGADKDQELLNFAQALLEKIKAQPGGEQIVQQATGNYIAQAAQHSTAKVIVGKPPDKEEK
jgi:hypothetical protein